MRGVKGGSEEMIEDVPSFITIVSGGDWDGGDISK